MKTIEYKTKGTCSKAIKIELDESGIITDCKFISGCPGNTSGVAELVKGMHKDEAIRRLRGIKCGMKPTSCPDQLARALEGAE